MHKKKTESLDFSHLYKRKAFRRERNTPVAF